MRKLAAVVGVIVTVLILAIDPASAATTPARTTGLPTSSNGASSMHLTWPQSTRPTTKVSAIITIAKAPTVSRLYFWALQAEFLDAAGTTVGAAHLGLQWNPAHPGSTAVNFGGYTENSGGATELTGTESQLPSTPGNANTRDFAWVANRSYQLTISDAHDGWWTGSVTDMTTGTTTVIRQLHGGGVRLGRPTIWTESFAHCEDPSVAATWSQLSPRPTSLLVTYQSFDDGGCTNTNTNTQPSGGVVQRTNTRRTTVDYQTLRSGS